MAGNKEQEDLEQEYAEYMRFRITGDDLSYQNRGKTFEITNHLIFTYKIKKAVK